LFAVASKNCWASNRIPKSASWTKTRTSVNPCGILRAHGPCGVHQHRVSRSHGRLNSHRWRQAAVLRKAISRGRLGSTPMRGRTSISDCSCGLRGRAQIGKVVGPCRPIAIFFRTRSLIRNGANTAWCPPRPAATCHASALSQSERRPMQTQLSRPSRARSMTF